MYRELLSDTFFLVRRQSSDYHILFPTGVCEQGTALDVVCGTSFVWLRLASAADRTGY